MDQAKHNANLILLHLKEPALMMVLSCGLELLLVICQQMGLVMALPLPPDPCHLGIHCL